MLTLGRVAREALLVKRRPEHVRRSLNRVSRDQFLNGEQTWWKRVRSSETRSSVTANASLTSGVFLTRLLVEVWISAHFIKLQYG